MKTSRHVPKGIEDIPNWFDDDDDDDDDDESDELFFAETKPTPPFKVSNMLVTFARRQKRQIALRDEEERKRDGVPSLVLLLFRRRSRCRFFSITITLSVCDTFFLFCVSKSHGESKKRKQQKKFFTKTLNILIPFSIHSINQSKKLRNTHSSSSLVLPRAALEKRETEVHARVQRKRYNIL